MEDVLVKVNNVIFPIDFLLLDIKEEIKVPITSGSPFILTSRAIIDLEIC